MRVFRLPLFLIALILSSAATGCNKPSSERGEAGADTPQAASDSLRKPRIAEGARMRQALDHVARIYAQTDTNDPVAHFAYALYSNVRALMILARALDNTSSYEREIEQYEKQFVEADTTLRGAAAQITNGMVGVYTAYGLLYKMRFLHDQERMARLDTYKTSVEKQIGKNKPPILAIAAMAKSCYLLSEAIIADLDTAGYFSVALEQTHERYQEGERVAQTDEERTLNGLFRTFEVAQLWALSLDPSKRVDISSMNKELIGKITKTNEVSIQIADAAGYLYKMNDFIARKTLDVNNF